MRPSAAIAAFCVLVWFSALAQESGRKLIHEVEPQYSPILKDKQIGGVVKIIAVVSPSGAVTRTETIGGNPILVTAAQNAVKQWKYSPAATETRQVVTFRFDAKNRP